MQKQTQQIGISSVVRDMIPGVQPDRINDSRYHAFDVRWLPSMPLLNKRNAPPVAGIGILYSEEQDRVFHIFETANLHSSINSCTRRQTSALARDPNCRLSWYETNEECERIRIIDLLGRKNSVTNS